jgi:hypothetical protein
MKLSKRGQASVLALTLLTVALIRAAAAQSVDDSEIRPPVSKADVEVVKKARQILDSPGKWNRADNRSCPETETKFSLYCALEKATDEVTGDFAHRGAAMQQARFVIDDDLAPGNNYDHRLMGFNNDPRTTFADVRRFFDLLQGRIEGMLESPTSSPQPAANPPTSKVTQADIEIVRRVEAILDSPTKWDRASTDHCQPTAKTFGLYCAFEAASMAVAGKFDDDEAAINETRLFITNTAPNAPKYQARLIDYNNDPTVTLADVQRLLKMVEINLEKRAVLQGQ